MGRQRLGAYIRSHDIVKAQDQNSIGNLFIDWERTLNFDEDVTLTLDEIKDGYAAFRERVCVPQFGYRHEHAYWAASSILSVMERIQSDIADESEKNAMEIGEQQAETFIALIRARPSSAHVCLAKERKDDLMRNYIKSCTPSQLSALISRLKITFKYDTKDTTEEQTYASFLSDTLRMFYKQIKMEHCLLIQKDFLEVYIFYLSQLPKLSKTMRTYIGYLVRDMVDKFPNKNPYTGFKDVAVIRKHINILQDICCTAEDSMDDLRVEDVLEYILKAAMQSQIGGELFGDCMEFIVAITERTTPLKDAGRLYSVFRHKLFEAMGDNNLKPDVGLFNLTVDMITRVTSATAAAKEKWSGALVYVLRKAVDNCITPLTGLTPELTKVLLKLWVTLLNTGRKDLCYSIKCVDEVNEYKKILWKNYVGELQAILLAIGRLPVEAMEADERRPGSYSGPIDYMKDFLEKLFPMIRKVMPQLQEDLVQFVFNCINISGKHKDTLADKFSGSDYIKLSCKKDGPLIDHILDSCICLLQQTDMEWTTYLSLAVDNLISACIKSYNDNGKLISAGQHEKYRTIFLICCEGDDVEDRLIPDPDGMSVYFRIYLCNLLQYIGLIINVKALGDFVPVTKRILKWAKLAMEEDLDTLKQISFAALMMVITNGPAFTGDLAPEMVSIFLDLEQRADLTGMIMVSIYPHNTQAFHSRLQDFFEKIEELKDNDQMTVVQVLTAIADKNPQVFTASQIEFLLEFSLRSSKTLSTSLFPIILSVAKRNPKVVAPHLKSLKNDRKFGKESLTLRIIIVGTVAVNDQKCRVEAIDHLMTYASPAVKDGCTMALNQLCLLVREERDYFKQKHQQNIEKLEQTTRDSDVKTVCQNLIDVLDDKNFEDIEAAVMQQQEDLVVLDKKVAVTMDTVVNIGDQVIQQAGDISDIQKDIDDLDDKVDDVDTDLQHTKVKVEEIDNKTMTNAPKWSRDLTKLMNPKSDADWRLLASRLQYNNEDIRGWAQQHDPCMALLSEWYATHKTSEATKGLLNILQEMNRMDAAVIVENAMKASEDVVEDEEFEYASPPPVFLSYQWGVQNEVKLLKQHLEMAGYTCWMDIGQMGGGDKLFDKIDKGIRAAKVIISCTTEKYAQSPNCNREVGLSVNLQKPIIPLLMEKMSWPPKGPMGPVFSEFLFVRFFQRAGEETTDNRYWPLPKFQELLMQLSFYVVPDQSLIQPEYASWWAPAPEVIVIDKKKTSSNAVSAPAKSQITEAPSDISPLVFLSYQWGRQPQVKILYERLVKLGYTVWMDIHQMGGGDSLYDKIDRGMRGCKVVVSCVTPKYALSANCRREISLADALKKPIVPLLLEESKWPPDGAMSMVFTELLYINMYRDENIQTTWTGAQFDELVHKLQEHVPEIVPGAGGSRQVKHGDATPTSAKSTSSQASHKSSPPKKAQATQPTKTTSLKPVAKATRELVKSSPHKPVSIETEPTKSTPTIAPSRNVNPGNTKSSSSEVKASLAAKNSPAPANTNTNHSPNQQIRTSPKLSSPSQKHDTKDEPVTVANEKKSSSCIVL